MRLYYRLFICIAVLFCVSAVAEEIELNDGTKVVGKITNVNGEIFKVRTSYGEIQIPRAHIVSISFPENQPKEEAVTPQAKADETLNGNTYTNRTVGMQLTVAKDWTMAPKMVSGDIRGALRSGDDTLFLFITPEKFTGTMATYKVLVQQNTKGTFAEFEKLSDTDFPIDGKIANRLIWHGKNVKAANTPMKAVVYTIPYEGRMVRLTFLTLEELFDDGLPAFDAMAKSYKSLQ